MLLFSISNDVLTCQGISCEHFGLPSPSSFLILFIYSSVYGLSLSYENSDLNLMKNLNPDGILMGINIIGDNFISSK